MGTSFLLSFGKLYIMDIDGGEAISWFPILVSKSNYSFIILLAFTFVFLIVLLMRIS